MNFDPLDTCPYDPVHRVLRSRMQYHLTRCSKNFPGSKKQKCPFDACHVVNQVEYNYHINNCPARESVLHYQIQNPDVALQKIVPIQVEPVVEMEENWENDPEVKTYNPLQQLADRPIVRTLIGASKAKRKQFRMEERRRIQQIEHGIELSKQQNQALKDNSKNSVKSKGSKAQSSQETYDQENKPLRRPKNLQLNHSNVSACDQSFTTLPSCQTKTVDQTEIPTTTEQTVKENTNEKIDPKEKVMVYPTRETEKKVDTDQNNKPVASTKKVPFSYAAALNNKNKSVTEENDMKNMQNHKSFNNNNNNNSINISLNHTFDESIIEKMSKTMEDIALADEVCTKESKPIEEQIKFFKQVNNSTKSSKPEIEKKNEKGFTTVTKKFSRCAANFPDLK